MQLDTKESAANRLHFDLMELGEGEEAVLNRSHATLAEELWITPLGGDLNSRLKNSPH